MEKKLQLETKSAKVLYRKNEDLNKNVWHLKKNLEEERKRTVSWKTKFEFLEKKIYNRNEEERKELNDLRIKAEELEKVKHKLQCRYVVNDNILKVNDNLRRKIKRLEENGNSSVNNEEGREKSQKIEQLQYDLKMKN